MLRSLLYRPVAVLMTTLGLCVLGAVVLQTLPIGLLPDIAIPRITVQVNWPDRSARELEDAVVLPLRNRLLQVSHLEDLHSESRNGAANIHLSFAYGTNTDLAFIEVNEQIDQVSSYLPREVPRPRVLKANVSDLPVFYLSVVPKVPIAAATTPTDLLDLSEFARSVLKRRIEQLPAVAFVDLSGMAEPEVRVQPYQQQLRALGLTTDDLHRTLEQNNLQLGSILLQDGQYQYAIRFSSRLQTVEDIGNIYLRVGARSIRLAELADIGLYARPARGEYRFQDSMDAPPGRRGLVMSVRKQADARLYDLQADFAELLTALRLEYPLLDFYIVNDQSDLLRVSIDNLLTSLLYGSGFAFLVLLLFFREWRVPVLISLVIPVALIIAMFGLYLTDISINIISLAGLILGVGLMIDNSIIVIENIRQQRSLGLPLDEACIRGGEEVIRPLLSSALTTCSVFLPLIFLSGLAGALFYDQAMAITIALGASLLVAYLLLPVLVYQLAARRPAEAAAAITGKFWLQQASHTRYGRSVDVVLRYRYLFLLVVGFLLAAGLWQIQRSERAIFPELTRPAIGAQIDWNESISLAANTQRLEELLQAIDAQVDSAQLFVGEQQFLLADWEQRINEARLHIFPAARLPIDTLELAIQRWITEYSPSASVRMAPVKNLFDQVFAQEEAPLIIQLQNATDRRTPEPQAVQPIVDTLRAWGVQVVLPPRQEQYAIRIRRADALRYGVEYVTIYDRLRTLFNQNQINTLQTGNQAVPIVLAEQPQTFYRILNQASVLNRQRDVLPLHRFVEVQREEAYKSLRAGRSGEAYEIELDRYSPALETRIRAMVRQHDQLMMRLTGAAYESRQQVRELLIVLTIALLLLYLILAAQFESLLQPLIVMLTVPAGIVGAVFVLHLAGQSLNLISIIGITVMSGIVVNDAILKVDMMNRLIREGHSLTTAIHGAGKRRLRPILMTSLTTMLALTPVLFSDGLGAELQQPLAWAVIGGLAVGTLASLYLLPVLYSLIRIHPR